MKDATIGARLILVRTQMGLSQEQMALAANIPLSTYKKYELNTRTPGGEALAGLARAGINLHWLLNEDGEALRSGEHPARAEQMRGEYRRDLPTLSRADLLPDDGDETAYVQVPGIVVSAGPGREVLSDVTVDAFAFKAGALRSQLGVPLRNLRLTYVTGDSMRGTLEPSDMVFVDVADVTPNDGIFVVRIGNTPVVKRLQILPGGVVKVLSDNPRYEAIDLTERDDLKDGVSIIGRVVGRLLLKIERF